MNLADIEGHEGQLTLKVSDVARLLGIGRASAYEACRVGVIPSIRIGRRIVIPRMALERLLSETSSNGVQGDVRNSSLGESNDKSS